MDKQVIMQK
jgi:hypothetical protein